MKRTAVSLFMCCAISGWAAAGHAKRGGGAAKAAPAVEAAPAQAEGKPAPAAGEKAGGNEAAADEKEAAPSESIEEEGKPGKVEEGGEAAKPLKLSTTSWQDIVVVPRKPFLKGGRVEFAPFTGMSINDNLIRHYAFGADINFFLSDVFWIGVQGEYFIKSFTEREDLIGLQYDRIPTLNRYLYGAAFNLGYVPIYGKFALINKAIIPWEIYASGGIGWTRSQVIPRNVTDAGWTNDLLTANVALGSRFFLFDWLTVNFAFRDYIMADKFEPLPRPGMTLATVADRKANADSKLVQNVMFYAGVGMYLPAKFQYKSPR